MLLRDVEYEIDYDRRKEKEMQALEQVHHTWGVLHRCVDWKEPGGCYIPESY